MNANSGYFIVRMSNPQSLVEKPSRRAIRFREARRAVVTLLALVVWCLTFAGCDEGWKTVSGDPPLAGPNEQAVQKEKDRPGFNAPRTEIVWESTEGDPVKAVDVLLSIQEFLKSFGYPDEINAARNAGTPPPMMRVVSVNPIVVIITPFEMKHQRIYQDNVHLLGANATVTLGHLEFAPISLSYGTTVFFEDGMQWFSPDLKQKPAEIEFNDDGVARIDLPKGKLMLKREDVVCKVARE